MNIYGYTKEKLKDYFVSYGQNPAKAKIVFDGIYKQGTSSFCDIKNLSDAVKDKLDGNFSFELPELIAETESTETKKYLFRLSDGNTIESVLMKHDYGNGLCISTQVGCNMNCSFCESGKIKKIRNLEVYEMVGQVIYIRNKLKTPISHIVLMGIGEPFDNYNNVMDFIDIATEQTGLAIAARHITISTCGITPKIKEYANRQNHNSLAISIHAPNDELRNQLMPINKAYPLKELIEAAKDYTEKANKKITFAYTMIKDINDSDKCAEELAELLKGINCYINLIPCNKTRSTEYEPSTKERIARFFDILKENGFNVTVRREFGGDMNAACGQLSSDYKTEKHPES